MTDVNGLMYVGAFIMFFFGGLCCIICSDCCRAREIENKYRVIVSPDEMA